MAAVANAVISKLYTVTFNIVRKKIIQNVDRNDVALGELHQQLSTEFEQVNAKLNRNLAEPFKSAHSHMKTGLAQFRHGQLEAAFRSYQTSFDKSVEAFNLADTFKDKVAAARLKIMCILYLNNHFHGECTENNRNLIIQLASETLQELTQCAEVRSSIRDQFEVSLFAFGSRKGRREVFDELQSLVSCVRNYEAGVGCQLATSNGAAVRLRDVAPVKRDAG